MMLLNRRTICARIKRHADYMSARLEALALVSWLLEAMARLLPPTMWASFTAQDEKDQRAHGRKQFMKRVDDADVATFCEAMSRLVKNRIPIMVPDNQHWALKMPGGYAIFGERQEGVTCSSKRETIAFSQMIIENPTMTELENRQWEAARRSL